ncbi:MAG: 30S ribosome-binding factor RbfA [Saprospiraceae bacterium]|nr:30S ribosome-binding factor RbfA [Saprospiraceae bacterium]
MASKRQEQVAELIKRNFGVVLQQEGSYIYGNAFVTVTQVQVTPDLSQAKLYISVFNTENKQEVLLMLERETRKLKQALAYRIRKHVRRIPDISIFLDDTLDEMYKLNEIFDNLD